MRGCLAFVFVCAACGSGSGGNSPADTIITGPAITGVVVSGPSTLAYYSTATLTATVQGTGNFSPIVNWVIQSGGGQLSATTGTSVQYTAPLVLAPAAVEVYAVSDADRSKVGRLAIAITPAPTAEQAVAGLYQGDLHDYEHGPPTPIFPDGIVANRHLSGVRYTIAAAGPNIVHLTAGPFYGAGSCSNYVVSIRLNNDGTFAITPIECASYYCCYPPCQVTESVLGGTGTWDYRGNLSFALHMVTSHACLGSYYSDQTFTNGHRQ
jgi:hypothetical protein